LKISGTGTVVSMRVTLLGLFNRNITVITATFRLFKPVRSEPLHDNNRKFLHIPFANKGIDAINISNILNRKEVVKEIPS
jgi:hypothetical protein